MGLLSSKNQDVKYFLFLKDFFAIYASVKSLMDEKAKTIINDFIRIVKKSKCKPNKWWVDIGR